MAFHLVVFTIKRCGYWGGTEFSVWLRCSQPYIRGCEISDFCVCVLLWLMITSGLWHLDCYLQWSKLGSVSCVVTRDWKKWEYSHVREAKAPRLMLSSCWLQWFIWEKIWRKNSVVFHPFNPCNSLVPKEYFRFWHL